VTITETVTNNGPGPASGTTVTDTSSVPVTVVTAKPSQGSCHVGQPTTCSLGTIAKGEHVTIKIVAKAPRTGVLKNAAVATSRSKDAHPANNLDSTRTTITPVLRLSKTTTPPSINTGGTVTYRLKVTNPGSIMLHNVELCDRLPRGLAYVSSSPTATLSNGRRCWHFATLNAHQSKVAKVVARALPGASGNLTNHATATANGARTARAQSRLHVNPSPPPHFTG
jgi:uncharacterized repeat protein (TIGR01451 family)